MPFEVPVLTDADRVSTTDAGQSVATIAPGTITTIGPEPALSGEPSDTTVTDDFWVPLALCAVDGQGDIRRPG